VSGAIDTGFLDAEGDTIRARLIGDPPSVVKEIAADARRAGPVGSGADRRASPFGPADNGGTDPWTSLRNARV